MVKRAFVCLLTVLLARSALAAQRQCYDLTETLAHWEGLRLQAQQSKPLFDKTLHGPERKTMDRQIKAWVKQGARPDLIDGAAVLQKSVNSCYPQSLDLLLQHHIDPNFRFDDGSVLHAAVSTVLCDEAQALQIVKELVDAGARVDALDAFGETPLMRAALAGRATIADFLLSRGAKLEAVDCMGRTPLHWAAAAGEPATVQALLARGAKTHAKDATGKTPAQLAAELSHRTLPTFARYEEYRQTAMLLQKAAAPAAHL